MEQVKTKIAIAASRFKSAEHLHATEHVVPDLVDVLIAQLLSLS
jgi:hypothetical protein